MKETREQGFKCVKPLGIHLFLFSFTYSGKRDTAHKIPRGGKAKHSAQHKMVTEETLCCVTCHHVPRDLLHGENRA